MSKTSKEYTTGLRERILTSENKAEVKKLLAEGNTYEFTSKQTKNAWKNAARHVLNNMG